MKMMSTIVCAMLQFHLLFSNYGGAVADAKHVGCIEKERHALLELKASLVLDDTSLLPTWDSKSHDCCAWEGIVCSNQSAHVEMLDLNGYPNGLYPNGKINASLLELQHLKYLNLSYSEFSNSIFPEFFGSLSNLRFLDLRASFDGGRVPNDLSHLSHLQYLDLSRNGFEGTIPHQLGNLSHLQHLDISNNYLLKGTIPHQLGNLSHLQYLDLSFNNLGGTIPHQLGNLSHLQYLDLSDNNLGGTIPHQLGSLSNLQELNLGYNQLNVVGNLLSGKVLDGVRFLPSKLESLAFQSNSLEGGIPYSFDNLCSLKSLDLSNNNLSEDLSVILHNMSVGCAKYSLQNLNLDANQITGMIPDMSGFSSLKNLFLSDNLLNGSILKNFNFPSKLEVLYLDSNNMKGVISDSHFDNMSMLMYLDLSHNSLALKFSENWLPPFQLSTIYLSSCILGPSFPKWLHSQKYLQRVDISNSGISDVVPMWFWNQATYTTLVNISYNNIIGTIPNLPIRFSEGCRVNLDSNQFEGSIPPFFQSARYLGLSKNKFSEIRLLLCTNTTINNVLLLDLSKNQLSTQLPDCWSHFKELTFLDLSDNTLFGEVPSSMGSLSKLKILILRNNSLAGKLPISLKNCTNLVMLDLGDNGLSGPIPYWLGQQLQMLSLRRNQLSGSLPPSLCYLTDIQLLDLSENNLSGRIFKCLKNFSAMSHNFSSTRTVGLELYYSRSVYAFDSGSSFDLTAFLMWKGEERLFKNNMLILRSIDLSSNQLTGVIPEEIGSLTELVSLNLSRNNLSGEITSKIGKLTSLDSLDLSKNYLFGPIPPSLSQIDRLAMLNLSDNNLSGRIPIGTQLQSFEASSYEGNVDLCGKPLDKTCPGDEEVVHQKPETHEESNEDDKKPLYLSVTFGFITGFWGLWGSLFLSRNWRNKYVLFLNNIIDTIYVFMVLNATKFQRWLRGLLEKFV
ncbi:receptor-like protein EIX2 isoform X2 [Trifolium pratense]|uniref:receptor-like protein EIX2 isoform X2 n=1 Tax=Trifolium pratense TaxID=57577 RepID=UPI001E697C2C|nr:receptor-like protein EIX2 isoform X2 [Trifolium pratense]